MADQTETKTAETAAPVAPAGAGQKARAKPSVDKKPSDAPDRGRRRMIWAFVWGYMGVNFLMFLRFFFPRTLFEPSTVFPVGYPADFNLGVETKFQKEDRVWVVKEPDKLFVIYARCTHLGCTVDRTGSGFHCPCHGSVFDQSGAVLSGPAPSPLAWFELTLSRDGHVVIDTSQPVRPDKYLIV